MKAILVVGIFTGCIMTGTKPVALPTPTPKPTIKPTAVATPLPGSTMFPTPVPTPVASYKVIIPQEINQNQSFLVYLNANSDDEVKIYADKKFFISPMLWDEKKHQKYMSIVLHSNGRRSLDFKINGEWKVSIDIVVK